MLTVSIAIHNPDEQLFLRMLESLKKYTPELLQLIIIDNASEKDYEEVIRDILKKDSPDEKRDTSTSLGMTVKGLGITKEVKVDFLKMEKNIGFGRAHNLALKIATGKYFAVLNDDIEFYENWSTSMIKILQDNPDVAQVGPKKDVCNSLTEHGQGYWTDIDEPEYCEGSCFIMPTALAKKYGLFDERYKFAYFEDTDLSLRLRKDKYKLRNIDIKWKHHRAVTTKKVEIDIKGLHIFNEWRFKHRWNAYLVAKRFGKAILIKREAALGDVFLITPIIQALKEKYPDSAIFVQTKAPQAIQANNDIDYFVPFNAPFPCDEFIDLDYAYEKDFTCHIVDAYARVAGVKVQRKRGILYISPEDKEKVDKMIPEDFGDFICMDWSDTWMGKMWNKENYNILTQRIREQGMKVVSIGRGGSLGSSFSIDLNFFNQLTPIQTGYMISKAKMFIGHEGLLGHFAQSVNTPAVLLYGCTKPKYVNEMTSILRPVITPAACGGCRHRYAAGTGIICARDGACMKMITVDMVYEGYEELRKKTIKL